MHASKGLDLQESVTSDADRTAAHYQKTGDLITLPYNEVVYTEQPFATRVERVQPVVVSQWLGKVELTPSSDNWFETEVAPALVINVEGNFNTLLNENKDALGTVWNAWQTQWSGVVSRTTTTGDIGDLIVERTIETTRTDLTRTGVNTQVIEKIEEESLGNRVLSRALIPFVRPRTISVVGECFRPGIRLYAFFDGRNMSTFVTPTPFVPNKSKNALPLAAKAGAPLPHSVVNFTLSISPLPLLTVALTILLLESRP